jgi:hypothetical protein
MKYEVKSNDRLTRMEDGRLCGIDQKTGKLRLARMSRMLRVALSVSEPRWRGADKLAAAQYPDSSRLETRVDCSKRQRQAKRRLLRCQSRFCR